MSSAHSWSQSDSEVVVRLPLDPSVGKEKLKVKIEASRLAVHVAGAPAFEEELAGKAVVDESYWHLEGAGADRAVVVTLGKKKSGTAWGHLTKAEEASAPAAKNTLAEDFNIMDLEHDDDDPERVEEQEENERILEARYRKLKEEKGLGDEETLKTFFGLFDNCIQLYRLNKLADYLVEIVPVCRKRTDKYKLKAIQALAFVRWKQSKFREALPLFHEMEEILGKGAALCENIAHTYNSLGDYDKAEEYFRQALAFIEQEHGFNQGNRGGVLLGLGLVRDRLGKHREALPVVTKAYEFYKERANGAPASLQAKAGISCAKINAKLGNLPKAETYIREAITMYEVTCGEMSPLTASAYYELGRCCWDQKKREEARLALKRAYEIEAKKDAWDLVTLLEIHNLLMDTHLKETQQIERTKFTEYFPTVEYVVNRVRGLPQDGNAAVYYKAAAELKAWGARYEEAKKLFNEAIPLFEKEQSTDCRGLIQSCRDMLAFCDRNLAGMQNSPMDFKVPEKETEPAWEGPTIEEVLDEPMGSAQAASSSSSSAYPTATSSSSSCPAHRLPPPQAKPAAAKPAAAPREAPAPQPVQYRPALPDDFVAIMTLCVVSKAHPLLGDQASWEQHLAGPGRGICWVADRVGDMLGLAVCGSDGIFGRALQLLLAAGVPTEDCGTLRRGLLKRCAEACASHGLRSLHAEAAFSGKDGEADFFGELGWSESRVVYSSSPGSGKAGKASSASAATAAKLRRGGEEAEEEVGTQPRDFGAWDKMDVEKTLVEDDGVDPSVVPDRTPAKEDFGAEVAHLDVSSRITKFAWDQSKQNVSVYISWDGAGDLPAESVTCLFKTRGVLLTIESGGKKHWFAVANLCKEIVVDASDKKIKSDQVVIKLRKAEPGEQWSDLNDDKDRYQKQREFRIAHGDLKGATTEQLLADMYQNANDEERAGLRDAMRINRQKREEEARGQ